ncbi:MAG: DUF1800 family protein [Saprospiraceae bacterium]|nr:DUF1800 family protein [Saprospiraceae bacterium]
MKNPGTKRGNPFVGDDLVWEELRLHRISLGSRSKATFVGLNGIKNMSNAAKSGLANWSAQDYEDSGDDDLVSPIVRIVYSIVTDRLMTDSGLNFLFWHNHFVTGLRHIIAINTFGITIDCWNTHCFGNFKTFVSEMGKSPAMLVFSTVIRMKPNETMKIMPGS